jgi:hypothetical protein
MTSKELVDETDIPNEQPITTDMLVQNVEDIFSEQQKFGNAVTTSLLPDIKRFKELPGLEIVELGNGGIKLQFNMQNAYSHGSISEIYYNGDNYSAYVGQLEVPIHIPVNSYIAFNDALGKIGHDGLNYTLTILPKPSKNDQQAGSEITAEEADSNYQLAVLYEYMVAHDGLISSKWAESLQ